MSININQLLPSKNPIKANEQTKIIKPNNVTTTNDKPQDTKATIVDEVKIKRKRGRPRKTKTNEEHKRNNKKNRNHISKEQLRLIKQQEHENRVAKEEYMKQQRRKHAIISNYVKKQTEVDFVANLGSNRYYIQCTYRLPTLEKEKQEIKSLTNIPDSFKKIIIVRDNISLRRDDNGIVTMSLKEFLLKENALNT